MHPISVDTYHRLGEIGHLSERTELIRGVIIDQMPRTPLHTTIVALLDLHLRAVLPAGWHPRPQEPLTLAESEPEPDIAVVRGAVQDYFKAHPTTAGFVIEVVASSEALDRVKLGVYAEAGLPEAWLILAEERVVECHTDPQGAAYQRIERVAFPATLESTVFPGLTLPPIDLFPG